MFATDKYGNTLTYRTTIKDDEFYHLKDKCGNDGEIYLCCDDYIWGNSICHRFKIKNINILSKLREDIINQYIQSEKQQISNYIYNIMYCNQILNTISPCADIIDYIVHILCSLIAETHHVDFPYHFHMEL
jgi:hypothetical protein